VDYTQLFRKLREARGLTLEELARLARVHRNTVVNIESGRQVRFRTIATLMRKMGYPPDSAEMKSIALLWLESVSGIALTRPEVEAVAQKTIAGLRGAARERATALQHAVVAANLSADQIELLIAAARQPALLTILREIRDLVTSLAGDRPARAEMLAAEPKAPYPKK
jgi:transcriptional regulator with XRE-family HTH domain